LKDKDQVVLANWFLDQLALEDYEINHSKYCNPQQDLVDWVNYVNKKQD
jgi:hypothetical protein